MILHCATCGHRWLSDAPAACPLCATADELERLRGACRPLLPFVKAIELPPEYAPPHPASLALPDPPPELIAAALRALRGVADVMTNPPRGGARRRGAKLFGPPRCGSCGVRMELVAGDGHWVCVRCGTVATAHFTWRAGTPDAARRALERSGEVVVVDAQPAREIEVQALPEGDDDT